MSLGTTTPASGAGSDLARSAGNSLFVVEVGVVVAPLAVAIHWGLVELLAAQTTGVRMLLHGRAGTSGSAGRLHPRLPAGGRTLGCDRGRRRHCSPPPPTFPQRTNPNAAPSRSPRVGGVAPPGDSES